MSPEERKRKEEEEERERARFVRPTMVPMPPQPQQPQIQQQPQQPGVLQQFGQAFATAGIDKGVDMAMKAIPFFINKGAKVPEAVGPLAQSQDEINKWYQEMYDKPHDSDNLDDPYLDNIRDLMDPDDPMLMAQKQGVVFDLHTLPPRLRSEYIQRLKAGMGHDDIIRLFESRAGKPRDYMQGTIQRFNDGGEASESPSVTTIWDQYNNKGMTPAQFNVPVGNQQVSPSKESYWQKAERTGLFGVPGTQNVYVDPGKGTIAYQREDVKPFTWMWNKGRNFLGFGAPLARGSE